MVDRLVQEENLDALIINGGFQFTDTFFPYTSGEIGPYYVQSIVVEKNRRDYANAIGGLCKIIEEKVGRNNFDVIAGGESRDWDFSNPVAVALSKPHTKVYKDGKILAADPDGKKVIWVADLNNEGSSIRDKWYPIIKKAGGEMEHVFFYVDRLEDGAKVVKDLGLQSHALVPLDSHAWQYLQDKRIITEEVYNSLMRRMEDKNAWARNMLGGEKGISTLKKLLENTKTREKGLKIIHMGYPDLTDELLERVK